MPASPPSKIIWTIGHSTRSIQEFLDLLKAHQIEVLADVRRYPGSRKFPHFSKENLEQSLPKDGIEYLHFEKLGGRRKGDPDSKNTAWRLPSFRAYADYMETEEFAEAAKELQESAAKKRVAYMCSEAVWWSCHRALVSDYLKIRGWEVRHIMGPGKTTEHPYTKPAKIIDDQLHYSKL